MDAILSYLSPETILWVSQASPANVAMSIELGMSAARAIISAREAAAAAMMSASKIIKESASLVERLAEDAGPPRVATVAGAAVQLHAMSDRMQSPVSALRGASAERSVGIILREAFGGPAVQDTTKFSRSGDFLVACCGQAILVEVKNYSSTVPSREVAKFHRDLSAASASGGVFVSLEQTIAGVAQGFDLVYESVNGRVIPAAYLVVGCRESIVSAVKLVAKASYVGASAQANRSPTEEGLASLSRARSELQQGLGEITGRLIGLASNIVAAETKIREAVEDSSDTAVSASTGSHILQQASSGYAAKYSSDARSAIAEVAGAICASGGDDLWRITPKLAQHAPSGLAIQFAATAGILLIPRERLSTEMIVSGMMELGPDFEVAKQVKVAITSRAIPWIKMVLSGGPKNVLGLTPAPATPPAMTQPHPLPRGTAIVAQASSPVAKKVTYCAPPRRLRRVDS